MNNPFEKLVRPVANTSKAVQPSDLDQTVAFVSFYTGFGQRLSYGALYEVALAYGEVSPHKIPAQRGAGLAKRLPEALQPMICRNGGGYHQKVRSTFRAVRSDLEDLPVLSPKDVPQALKIWEEHQASEAEEASEA